MQVKKFFNVQPRFAERNLITIFHPSGWRNYRLKGKEQGNHKKTTHKMSLKTVQERYSRRLIQFDRTKVFLSDFLSRSKHKSII